MRKFLGFLLLATVVVCAALPAQAGFQLTITNGLSGKANQTQVFNGVGGSIAITNDTFFKGWNLNAVGALSKPLPTNGPFQAFMDIGIQATNTPRAQKLFFNLTDTDFTTVVPTGTLTSGYSNTKAGKGTSTFQSWAGANIPYIGIVAGSPVFTTGLQGPFTGTASNTATLGPITLPQPFAMTDQTVLNPNGKADAWSTDGATTFTAVPEPASMAMLLVGGPLLCLSLRRRRRQAAEPRP
jgi:hypothetical protein